ncbi:MAG: hypothetical protein JST16_17230 [Bdellovibrionales bacterium]|nr:hypothetical protein [Bdellovibrionales bacterium]
MTIGEHSDQEVVRGYFIVLNILARAEKCLRIGQSPPDQTVKVMPLFAPIEAEYAQRGYRPLLPACGALAPSQSPSAEDVAHLVFRRLDGEPAVFYADRLCRRLDRFLADAPSTKTPSRNTSSTATT